MSANRTLLVLATAALVVIIGVADYFTDWEWSMFIFYAIPILVFANKGSLKLALVTAILCGVVWHVANMASHPYRTTAGYTWASFSRMVYFIFVAIGGTALRKQREEMRARLEASQRARALEHEIVRVSEREQMRIGQDLHDGLCQQLAAIDCAAACLRADLETQDRPEASAAEAIQKMLKDAVLEARSLARGISPVHADAEDLPAVMEELTASANLADGIEATFTQEGTEPSLPPQTSLHVYRIAQEAVRNAIKHAGCSRIDIRLRQTAETLEVSVMDDGKGFVEKTNVKGMGVGTMRYRARLIGAELIMERPESGGTKVRCVLPLKGMPNGEEFPLEEELEDR